MYSSVLTAAILGMEVCPVQVEADISDGLPSFVMVGFPSVQVREAQDRIRTAFRNNQIALPPQRITVNLLPADIRKEGAGFDLPVAAAVLAAIGVLKQEMVKNVMMVGEIGLDGEIHPVAGILPRVLKARELGCRFCVIPFENRQEGRLVKDMPIVGVRSIREMIETVNHFCISGQKEENVEENTEDDVQGGAADGTRGGAWDPDQSLSGGAYPDFADICGQEGARRAAEIAASGFHNLLMIGPPGTGKTMLAQRLPGIMPGLTYEEKLELTKIYSVAGLLSHRKPLVCERPFRKPHHTCSPQALTGGGRIPSPGELTLAHRGVLFLDEMPEFNRRSLEALRQPLEERMIQISRAGGTYVFPAGFMLVAAMNPCPCGFYPDMNRCRCTRGEVAHYLGKISQPLLDRMDLCVEVSPVSYSDISSAPARVPVSEIRHGAESSSVIRSRVEKVRKIQALRYKRETIAFNGELTAKLMERYCVLTQDGERLMKKAFEKFQFSARTYHRILRVSRTIADMDGEEKIHASHVAEAVSFRAFDKKYWS